MPENCYWESSCFNSFPNSIFIYIYIYRPPIRLLGRVIIVCRAACGQRRAASQNLKQKALLLCSLLRDVALGQQTHFPPITITWYIFNEKQIVINEERSLNKPIKSSWWMFLKPWQSDRDFYTRKHFWWIHEYNNSYFDEYMNIIIFFSFRIYWMTWWSWENNIG